MSNKILFILSSLGSGGAEKVAVQLLNNLSKEKYNIAVVIFERKGEFLEDIPDNVHIYDLKWKDRYSFPKLVYKLSKIIKDTSPSLIMSFLIYSNFVALLARAISWRKIPVIIAEHSVPKRTMEIGRYYLLKKWLYKLLYPKAERIIAVSRGIKDELIDYWKIPSGKVEVVNNAVDLNLIEKLSREPIRLQNDINVPEIIAVGRLSAPKGYPYLLKAIKKVVDINPVHLLILGEGEEKKELERLAKEMEISDFISFVGYKENPYKYISNGKIFVLSSLWESFSIVLIEAMACGVPVVSTRCPYGPEEIITDGINGLLVPFADENALAEAILKLLNDDILRDQLIEAGKKRAIDFGIEKMIAGYERVFGEMLIDSNINANPV